MVANRPPTTLRVPADHPTIQAAVDATVAGDLVLVAPGTYRESVVIERPGIVVRGTDRAGVIIDGEDKRENGIKVLADGVAIENLTVSNHAANGVLVTGDGYDGGTQLKGFRLSYITAIDNDLYGLYSFAAQDGLFDNVYARGSGDSGFYVGRCEPCNTLVIDSLAEHNAVGFEGTNASVGVVVARSTFRANRVGITVNSQKLEKKAPQREAVVVGNVVDGNDAQLSPVQASGAFGLGIAIGGGRNDRIERNRVRRSVSVGIAITDLDGFLPSGVQVEGNALESNGTDIGAYRTALDLPPGAVCLGANEANSFLPPDLPVSHSCGPTVGPAITAVQPSKPGPPPGVRGQRLPAPPSLPNMVDALTAPAAPATSAPDLSTARFSLPS